MTLDTHIEARDFHQLMDLEPHGPDVFVGISPVYPWGRLYGGQVVAQALRAAAFTVDDRFRPHSLHAHFTRGGTSAEPVRYEGDRIRNGRSFITRRVVARQSNGAILNLSASFHVEEDQPESQTFELPSAPTSHGLIGGRGLVTGQLFSEAGVHVASIAQEVLLRYIGERDTDGDSR